MKSYPPLEPVEVCQAEIDEILDKAEEALAWDQEHRRSAHPTAPNIKRIYLVLDYGPETVPMIMFAGEKPLSLEAWSDTLARAWDLVAERPKLAS